MRIFVISNLTLSVYADRVFWRSIWLQPIYLINWKTQKLHSVTERLVSWPTGLTLLTFCHTGNLTTEFIRTKRSDTMDSMCTDDYHFCYRHNFSYSKTFFQFFFFLLYYNKGGRSELFCFRDLPENYNK